MASKWSAFETGQRAARNNHPRVPPDGAPGDQKQWRRGYDNPEVDINDAAAVAAAVERAEVNPTPLDSEYQPAPAGAPSTEAQTPPPADSPQPSPTPEPHPQAAPGGESSFAPDSPHGPTENPPEEERIT